MKKKLLVLLLLIYGILGLQLVANVSIESIRNTFNENNEITLSSIESDIMSKTKDAWRFEYTKMIDVFDDLESIDYSDIVVAVIDSGVDVNHPDLNIVDNIIGCDVAEGDDLPNDVNGHGTHIAGIIGAKSNEDNITGIVPGVKILPVKVFLDNGKVYTYYIKKGIEYAIDRGVDVINLSVNYDGNSDMVTEAIALAESKGIVIVSSTSNDSNHWVTNDDYDQTRIGSSHKSVIVAHPAALESVISVGALIKHSSKDELGLADYSNVGGVVDATYASVDVVAPGSNIYSLNPLNYGTDRLRSGTSMSAPHVTGLVALLRAKYPLLAPNHIREIVRKTAYDPGIIIPNGYNRFDSIGYGIIDINAALNFSPVNTLFVEEAPEFLFDSQKYNYLISVDSNVTELTFNGELMEGTTVSYDGNTYSEINRLSMPLTDDISVLEFEVEFLGAMRKYKFFVKYNQPLSNSRVNRIVVDSQSLNPIISESNMDYYITVDPSTQSIDFHIETVDSTDQIAFINADIMSDYVYNSDSIITVSLHDRTTISAFKIRTNEGIESSYMMAFMKESNSDGIYTYNELDPIIITNRVTIDLDTDAIVLDYGIDADPSYTSYDFQATVRGADKNDVVWSVDDDRYVTVDSNGVVTTRADVPDGLGDFSVSLKAQSVVGGAIANADILFLEKTPLGKVEFFAPYISGYTDGTFRPQNIITRAEVSAIFSKILNLRLEATDTPSFTDVNQDHWAYTYIQAMYQTGIFSGYEDGRFLPNAPIKRAEIAQVFTNYWNYNNIVVKDSYIVDIPDVSDDFWAADAIHRLYNTKVTTGYLNNAFRPLDFTTREELVYMVNKLLGREPLEGGETSFDDVSTDYFYYGDIEAASRFYVNKNEQFLD